MIDRTALPKQCPKCGNLLEKDIWGVWCPNGYCNWAYKKP